MARERQIMVVHTEPQCRAIAPVNATLTPRQNGDALCRFEAGERYRRATVLERRRKALCVDRLA